MRRAGVSGQQQAGRGDGGGDGGPDVTLGGAWAFEHGDLAAAGGRGGADGTRGTRGTGTTYSELLNTLNSRFNLGPDMPNGKGPWGSWQWETGTIRPSSDAGCSGCGPTAD
ncbi:hypothetical protein GCM10010259_59740 [Streptomyces daghestanicus]|uniref:Uncharacterized protein n=1 Tax=Streptomyces daghestanicus TaxID=66885 RepID=A0ABQ3Q5Z0_9ACTN|nr:hypothetical protein GCM10010240_24020 [Streptomyces griseoviridis]GGU61083.1 hypothetical protein GCM10010259_59740 [Streptomyces daghestanicus]GHI32666.1 hypothetical protein Sdagh_43960 [Streptomyces daghestanicus]